MNIGIVIARYPHHRFHAEALLDGLRRHGIAARIYSEHSLVEEEVVACWGWRLGGRLRLAGKQVLVMEHGFIDRATFVSLGWNGLNGRATFPPAGDSPRFERLFHERLRPWSSAGEYALIIGQVDEDMAVAHTSLPSFYSTCVEWCREQALEVRFRPHPETLRAGEALQADRAPTLAGTLDAALAGAEVVLTFNSNVGVDSLLHGKPTVALDHGSMAFGIAASTFEVQLEPDRRPWAERIAWCQWSIDELRDGSAWSHARLALDSAIT